MSNFFYIVDFNIKKLGGKSLGTRSKREALSKIFDLKFMSPISNNIFYRTLYLVYAELSIFFIAFFNKKDINIFLSRGMIGIFATKILSKTKNNLFVREVHAAPGEYKVIEANFIKKIFIYFYEKVSFFIDVSSDLRVFNHPHLLDHYKDLGINTTDDIFLFNGGSIYKNCSKEKKLLNLFELKKIKTILAFTGSVSSWHNIEDIIRLQDEFDKNNDDVQIIVGGGQIRKENIGNVMNISPLDEEGCNELINFSDACLMPVNQNRISPGSPLKLYQYLLASKPVITQANVIGYSDEVLKYKAGIEVDFSKIKDARHKIMNFIENDIKDTVSYLIKNKFNMEITWDDRMTNLKKTVLNHSKINQD